MLSIPAAVLAVCAIGGSQTVLLDFTAEWCGPCRGMAPIVESLSAAGYPVRKVDIDREPGLAKQFRVEGVPCFVLVVDGQEVDRVTGATSRDRLLSMCQKAKAAGTTATATVAANNTSVPVRLTSGNTIRAQSPDARGSRPRPLPPMAGGPQVSLAGAVEIAPPGSVHAQPVQIDAAPEVQQPVARPMEAAPEVVAEVRQPAAQPQAHPAADPFVQALAASVRLRIEDEHGHSWGSGTIIDAQENAALILTCGHVFRDSRGQGRITVDLFGPNAPQGLRGYMVSYDLKRDIGLLRIETEGRVPAVRVAAHLGQVQPGDAVASIGCASGGNPEVHPSRINSVNKFLGPPNLQVAGQPVQGRSGGGLFNRQGEIIGVCNAADPADNEGLFAALGSIHGVLDEAKLTQVYRAAPQAEVMAAAAPVAPPAAAPPVVAAPPVREMAAPPRELPRLPSELATPMAPARVAPRSIPQPSPADDLPHFARGRGPLSLLSRSGVRTAAFTPEMPASLAATPVSHAGLGHAGAEHAEVVCVIRSLSDPNAKSEVVVLDRVSPEFVRQLAAEQQVQKARHMTSLAVPKENLKPAAKAPASMLPSFRGR